MWWQLNGASVRARSSKSKPCATKPTRAACSTQPLERLNRLSRNGTSLCGARAPGRCTVTIGHGMWLVGTLYNFCTRPQFCAALLHR